jgi:hypothetical protein
VVISDGGLEDVRFMAQAFRSGLSSGAVLDQLDQWVVVKTTLMNFVGQVQAQGNVKSISRRGQPVAGLWGWRVA